MSGQDRFERLTRYSLREAVDAGKLKAKANTTVSIARDMAKKTDKPLGFHAEAGNLLAQLSTLFHEAGHTQMAKELTSLASRVHKRGEVFRHTDDWGSA